MKLFRKRPQVPTVPTVPKEEPFWQGNDGVAMEQCAKAVRIASQKVDPHA